MGSAWLRAKQATAHAEGWRARGEPAAHVEVVHDLQPAPAGVQGDGAQRERVECARRAVLALHSHNRFA